MMLLVAACFVVWMGCEPPPKDGLNLTFTVDMSAIELADADTVGMRGSMAPLSWTETYVMDGPDENGYYSVTIPFKDKDYGKRLQYKYIVNDSIWDNDRYGMNGNRVATICCNEQLLPIDEWDVLHEFAFESFKESFSWEILSSWIYALAKAKERGLTMEETAQEIVDFWNWESDPNVTPEDFMIMDELYQAKSSVGYFEMIENTPDKVVYIKTKDWEKLLYMWDPSGEAYGVSASDMTDMYRKMMEIYAEQNGFFSIWEDLDDHKVRITIMKE
jgi:hypothetical protein